MKKYRHKLRYAKTMARFFRKNNIREINIDHYLQSMDKTGNHPYGWARFGKTITVTFTDGTQKEAKSYRIWPPKIEF